MSLVVSDVARSCRSVRLRGRSSVARAVARDLPGATLSNAGITHFIPKLSERNVRMMRLQGANSRPARRRFSSRMRRWTIEAIVRA